MRYEISELAVNDLEKIWFYTADHWSTDQADFYYKEIIRAIQEICTYPEIGKPIEYVKRHHRRFPIRSHVIFYKIGKNTIYIDRILHERMDVDSHLSD